MLLLGLVAAAVVVFSTGMTVSPGLLALCVSVLGTLLAAHGSIADIALPRSWPA